jgi:glyoxylase-like metal-dependent hydrolase (beta-lactamase superfamily II)
MIYRNTGKIVEGLYMVGIPEMPVYLLDGEKPAIFDAGLAFLGHMYAEGIRKIIGNRDLHYCFLSHSHFDHCGSVPVLKKYFPLLKVVASEKAKRVFSRPNAIALMRELTRANEPLAGIMGIELAEFDEFEAFEVDVTPKDGEFVHLSSKLKVQVIETPGHTRDSLSYFIPPKKVLLCSEAAGIPDTTGYIVSEALVDYDLYYESMRRLSGFDFEILCLGHRQALSGRDAGDYFRKSMSDCRHFLNLVETSLLEEGSDVHKVVARVKKIEYDPVQGIKQSEPAYLLNLEAKVKAIKKRLENSAGNPQIVN